MQGFGSRGLQTSTHDNSVFSKISISLRKNVILSRSTREICALWMKNLKMEKRIRWMWFKSMYHFLCRIRFLDCFLNCDSNKSVLFGPHIRVRLWNAMNYHNLRTENVVSSICLIWICLLLFNWLILVYWLVIYGSSSTLLDSSNFLMIRFRITE